MINADNWCFVKTVIYFQVGSDGAGHYVKMVHNGIEYGDMQLICEAYHILKDALNLSHDELSNVRLFLYV